MPRAFAAPTADQDLSAFTVEGVTPRGTTINLFDYWITGDLSLDNKKWGNVSADELNQLKNSGINAGHTLWFGNTMKPETPADMTQNHWTGDSIPLGDLVMPGLGSDGYPQLSDKYGGKSLAYLFNTEETDGKAVYKNVGGLLQVDDQGYYYYNCHENFAEYNEETSNFTLYNEDGVKAGNQTPEGQFFPFNTGSQVFNVEGSGDGAHLVKDDKLNKQNTLNYYFGMSMETNFVQQNDGYVDEGKQTPVTYNFSGDDDVWVYIDGVLVGNLGGLHDMSSLQINFSTGDVVIYDDTTFPGDSSKYCNNKYDEGENIFVYNDDGTFRKGGADVTETTTLKELFKKAGKDISAFDGDTLPNDTYHTLNFFYLERGNTDSNMSLKYNLVAIPETDITKVDQQGNPIPGAEFKVYDATNGTPAEDAEPLCTATTEEDGTVVLKDNNGYPITVDKL